MKIERYVGEMFWLQNVGKLQIDENQNLDEITMTGEFGEEIDIVKEWIEEWKTLKIQEIVYGMNTMDTEEKPILYNNELFNNKGDK